jgi:hypothetical protein
MVVPDQSTTAPALSITARATAAISDLFNGRRSLEDIVKGHVGTISTIVDASTTRLPERITLALSTLRNAMEDETPAPATEALLSRAGSAAAASAALHATGAAAGSTVASESAANMASTSKKEEITLDAALTMCFDQVRKVRNCKQGNDRLADQARHDINSLVGPGREEAIAAEEVRFARQCSFHHLANIDMERSFTKVLVDRSFNHLLSLTVSQHS